MTIHLRPFSFQQPSLISDRHSSSVSFMQEIISNLKSLEKNTDQSIPFPHIKIENKYIIQLECRNRNEKELKYIHDNIGFENIVILAIFRFYAEIKSCRLINELKDYGFDLNNLLLCPNSKYLKKYYEDLGFQTFRINWHTSLRKDVYYLDDTKNRIYDVVYDGALPKIGYNKNYKSYKRHDLLRRCNKTKAFISRTVVNRDVDYLQECGVSYNYINDYLLSPKEVTDIYNQSKVGIMLSEKEGSCMASAQYLLCGLPVLSVYCSGGREDYYNEDNSLLVEADEDSVSNGIDKILSMNFDREKIRTNFLLQREAEDVPEWIKLFKTAFSRIQVDINVEEFFYKYLYKRGIGRPFKCSLFSKLGIK